MIIAGTGHRPDKLGGYTPEAWLRLRTFAVSQLKIINPTHVISGMALGWDQALANAAIILEIPWTAAIPFIGQESAWPQKSQDFYHTLLKRATTQEIVCPGGYSGAKMQIRNEWMVNHCDHVLALWDGTSGGTYNCLAYASRVAKPITNVWSQWTKE